MPPPSLLSAVLMGELSLADTLTLNFQLSRGSATQATDLIYIKLIDFGFVHYMNIYVRRGGILQKGMLLP